MMDLEALNSALQQRGDSAAKALRALCDEQHPSAADFTTYITTLVDYLESVPAPEHANLASAALSSLIERTALESPEPLAKIAPLVLPPLIRALATVPPVQQLSPALETLWLAARSESEQALRQWGIASRDTALRMAALGQLDVWVSGLNGRFAFRKFTPLVVSLLRDSSEAVRTTAYGLLVHFFASTSKRARDDLAEIMKKQQIADATRSKVLNAIAREMSGASGVTPPRTSSRPPSHGAARFQANSPVPSRTSSSSSASSASELKSREHQSFEFELDIVNDPSYALQHLEPANVYSEEELLTEVAERLPYFEGKESEANWSQRQDAIQRFRQMLRCKYVNISPSTLRETMKLMQRPLGETLLSLRTTLVGFSCQAVKDVAHALPPAFVPDVLDVMLEPLAHVAAGIKKITASAAHVTLCFVLIRSPMLSMRQFQTIKAVAQSKKPHARTYALYWLKAALLTSQQPISHMDERAADIERIAINGITDAVHTARDTGRQLYWVLYEHWPALAQRILGRLPPSAVKALDSSRPNAMTVDAADAAQRIDSVVTDSHPVLSSARKSESMDVITTPLKEDKNEQTPKSGHGAQQTPFAGRGSSGMSQSLADLSIHGPESKGLCAVDELDLQDQAAVQAAVRGHGALIVLRKLAISEMTPSVTSSVLKTVREQASEIRSAADIAKIVQTDLSGASMTQRSGYLQLLERLNYEQDTVESMRAAGSPALAGLKSNQIAMYVDSESSGSESSPRSVRSVRSRASFDSSISSQGVSDVEMGLKRASSAAETGHAPTSWAIKPFPSTEPACKVYIEGLVQQIEQRVAAQDVIAALAVLVTASAAPPTRRSPLFAAVDVWHRSYTFDMHLRDVILGFIATRSDLESVTLSLVLLRALLVTPTQTPAAAYLDPLACLRTVLDVLHDHGGKSLELDEHILPSVRDAIMKGERTFGSRSLLELLVTSYERGSSSSVKAFIIQTLELAIARTGLLVDEGAGVLPLVMKALDDGDAFVRKEAYPVLVTIQRENELLGVHAQTRMHAGQRRLLEHYLKLA